MKVLGIETSTLTASVAVVTRDGGRTELLASGESGVNTHSEELLVLVDAALRDAGVPLEALDGIAVGAGPGSFTGLRIGMATAKGLAFAADRPLWAVSSLAAVVMDLELDAPTGGKTVAAILDARRHEVFIGAYRIEDERAVAVADEVVIAPAEAEPVLTRIIEAGPAVAVGSGIALYADELGRMLRNRLPVIESVRQTPSGRAVAYLAAAGDYPDALAMGSPVYIRPSEAEIKFPRGNPGGTFSPGT